MQLFEIIILLGEKMFGSYSTHWEIIRRNRDYKFSGSTTFYDKKSAEEEFERLRLNPESDSTELQEVVVTYNTISRSEK
jgi:hypothetical protein